MSDQPETVMAVTITPDTAAFNEAAARSLDLDKLDAAEFTDRPPFSVRYGYRKISDWAAKGYWGAAPGRLWQLLADLKGTQQ